MECRSRKSRFANLIMGIALALAPACCRAEIPGWQEYPNLIDGSVGDIVSNVRLAMSHNGGAVIAWPNRTPAITVIRTASRSSLFAPWQIVDLDDHSSYPPVLAMNARGDAILAWLELPPNPALPAIHVNFRSAGSAWSSNQTHTYFSVPVMTFSTVSVAINSKGAAMVGWVRPDGVIEIATRPAGGAWPNAVEPVPGSQSLSAPVFALDNNENSIVVYDRVYGRMVKDIGDPGDPYILTLGLFRVLQQQLRSAAGVWSAPVDLTPRLPSVPSDGQFPCDSSFTGAPTIGSLRGASDPTSGGVGVSFFYYPSSQAYQPLTATYPDMPGECANSPNYPDMVRLSYAWGDAIHGLGAITEVGGGATNVVSVNSNSITSNYGFGSIGWMEDDLLDNNVYSGNSVFFGSGQVPVVSGERSQKMGGGIHSLAVGGDGTGFELFEGLDIGAYAVMQPLGGSQSQAQEVLPTPGGWASIAADGCGNALAAGFFGAGVWSVDYLSGKEGSLCAPAPQPEPTPTATPSPKPGPSDLARMWIHHAKGEIVTARKHLPSAPDRRVSKPSRAEILRRRKIILRSRDELKTTVSRILGLEKNFGDSIREGIRLFTRKNLLSLQKELQNAISKNERSSASAKKHWTTVISFLKRLSVSP